MPNDAVVDTTATSNDATYDGERVAKRTIL